MLGGSTLQGGGTAVAGPPGGARLIDPALKVRRHEPQRAVRAANPQRRHAAGLRGVVQPGA